MEERGLVGANDVYKAVFEMIVNAENISWNRFYNFLWFSSILIVSWATIWAATPKPGSAAFLIALCLLGIVSGIFWAGLGRRGRAFLGVFLQKGVEIENDSTLWAEGTEKYRSVCKDIENRRHLPCGWAGSWWLLQGGPLVISGFYVYMLFLTLMFF